MNNLNDNLKPIRGHFKIEVIDSKGNIIDSHEDHNLIMNNARNTMAEILAGTDGKTYPINKFYMGTLGHVKNSIFTPKREVHGFIPSRTDIFAEPSKDVGLDYDSSKEGITYDYIEFDPTTKSITNNVEVLRDGANNHSTVNVSVTGLEYDEPVVTYTIEIAQDAFNGRTNTEGMIYTECGLYTDKGIFAMKTFAGKIKEKTVGFRIVWSIIF